VREGVQIMDESVAVRQDIRPLHIGLLNLMPNKIATETQIARLIGSSPLQVELTLVRIGSHVAKNTSEDHLINFYHTWDEVKHRKFDGFIITGAPIETLPFEDVTYWRRAEQILDWTTTHVHSSFNVCWGAMAAAWHFHKRAETGASGESLRRLPAPQPQSCLSLSHRFLGRFPGFGVALDRGSPRGSYAGFRDADGKPADRPVPVARGFRNRLYIFNHIEYDSGTLAEEYFRDVAKAGTRIKPPANYFPDDNPDNKPQNRWRSHAFLLFGNWINQVYQTTPFDIEEIGEDRLALPAKGENA
jgi:homoserine O-succinyltransferase